MCAGREANCFETAKQFSTNHRGVRFGGKLGDECPIALDRRADAPQLLIQAGAPRYSRDHVARREVGAVPFDRAVRSPIAGGVLTELLCRPQIRPLLRTDQGSQIGICPCKPDLEQRIARRIDELADPCHQMNLAIDALRRQTRPMTNRNSSSPELDAQIALRISRAELAALARFARSEERSISYLIRRGVKLILDDGRRRHAKR